LCLVHELRVGLPVGAWVSGPSGAGCGLGKGSLVVVGRQRLRKQAKGRCRGGGAWERGVRGGVQAAEVRGRALQWARLVLDDSGRRA
jgi:hypothetical protein